MIKLLLFGLWVGAVAIGSVYAGTLLVAKPEASKSDKKKTVSLEYSKTSTIAVPILREGGIQGYTIAQFAYGVDKKALKSLPVSPEVPIVDQAFRTIYGDDDIDFTKMKKVNLDALTEKIMARVNAWYGSEVVHAVMIDNIRFLSKDETRGGQN